MSKYKYIKCNEHNYTKHELGRKIKAFVIHYTANVGDTAEGNARYFSREPLNASAHYFIDDREIVQSISDCNIAWSVGAKQVVCKDLNNNNTISIELCCLKDSFGKWFVSDDVRQNLMKLLKELKGHYGPLPLCRHFDITNKKCPWPLVENYIPWYNLLVDYINL